MDNFEFRRGSWARAFVVLAAGCCLAAWLVAPATAAPIAGGRIVYSNSTTTPQNRAYTAGTPGSFGAETATVAGATQAFMVDRAAPTRNEHIAGYVTTGGVLYIIRWNGTSWSAEWNVTVGGDGINGRRFDIAYENTSGRAMVVYSTNANQGLAYRIWDGTTWSAATNFTAARLVTVPAWIKLLPRPGSNEIALTVSDNGNTTTANQAVLTSLIWDGTSTWGNEPATAHATNLYSTTGQLIQNDLFDQAWETNTGYLMVVWTQATPQQYYRRFSGSPTRSWGTATSFATGRSAPLQMFAASDPNSNNIVAGWNRSASASVYATVWTGTAWSTVTAVGTNDVTPAANKKTITGRWLVTGGTSYPVVVWGTSTAGTVGYNYATVSGTTVTWGTGATFAFTGTTPGAWAWMDLDVDPKSADTLMLTFSDANSDLWAKQLTVTAGPTFTWGNADGGSGLTLTLASITTQNFSFAYDRFVPTLTIGNGPERPAASTTGPAATDQVVDQFTLTANSGTATVSQIVITLGGTGSLHVTNVKLWRDNATYGQLNVGTADVSLIPAGVTPSAGTATFSGLTESVGTTAVRYLVTYTYSAATNADSLTSTVTGATATGYTTANTATVSTAITIDANPPALITNFTATSGQNAQVPLAWTNPTDAALGQVVVMRKTGSYPTGHADGTATQVYTNSSPVSGGAVSTTDTTGPPVNGTTYYYAVYSRDAAGNWNDTTTAGSNAATATPQAPTLTIANGPERPAASFTSSLTATDQVVDQFTLTANSGTATVSQIVITLGGTGSLHVTNVKLWRDAATYGVLNAPADVQVGTTVTCAPTCTTATFSGLTESVTTTAVRYLVTYSWSGATNGDTLTSQVTGATATGYTTANTATVSNAITIDTVPPNLITNFTATSGQNAQVPLTWTNPTDAALGQVVVMRKTGSYPTGHADGTATQVYSNTAPVSGGAISTTDTTGPPVNGTTYYYAVYSRDAAGNWNDTTTAGSNAATATPQGPTLTIANGPERPAASTTGPAATDQVVDQFTLTANGTATVTQIVITLGGTGTSHVTNVKLWRDAGTLGQLDGADVQVGTTQTSFPGNVATFSGLSESVGTTAVRYLVTYTYSGGTAGDTLTSQVTGATATGYTTANTATVSNTITIVIPNMTVTATDYPAAASVAQGQTSVPLLKFQLSTDKSSVTWTAMKLDKIGTNANLGDVSFKIWKSARNRSTFDPWADTVIGSGTFSVATGQSVTLSTAQTVGIYPQYYFVTYDISASATLTTTVGAKILDNTYFTVTGGSVNPVTTVGSGTPSIAAPTVTPAISDNPAPSPVDRGQTNVPMLKFTLQTDNSTATWTAMKLDKIGTNAVLGDVSFKIWKDTNNTGTFDPVADTVIGSGTFTVATGQSVTLTTSQTITTTPQWFFVTYDVSGTATTGTTVGVQIQNNTYFTATGATIAPVASTASGTPTINAAPAVTVTPSSYPPPASVIQGQSDVPMLKFSLAATLGTAYWTAMNLDKIGTNANLGDVSFKVWKSASNTSTFNAAADTMIGAGTFSTATGQSVTLSQQQAIGTTAQWFFVTYSIHTAAATATTVGAQLANNTYFSMNGGTVNTFTSTASGTPSIGASGATISILNPRDGGKIGGTFKVQVLVYVPSGLGNLTALQLSNNGGTDYTFYSFNLANQPTGDRNTNYSAGTNAALYEKSFSNATDTSYHFKAQATVTGAGTAVSRGVRVSYTATLLGDGMLLVRDNSSQLCMDCHALNTHSSQSTTTTYGNWATVCLDCHTPHSTKNISLIRDTIQTPNSGSKTKVDFRTTTGDASYSYGDSANTTYSYNNICQVCHTQTKNPSTATARWRNSGATFDAHYTAGAGTQKCTNCHSHKDGFKGGESGGSVPCSGCHSNIWTPMNTTATTYHHYMQNADVTVLASGSKYPLVTSLLTTADANRRCLVCHVDHDIFRPDLNASGGRGKNLRTDANLLPTTTTNFTNTDFDATTGGICLSCHFAAQIKSYTQPLADSTTVTVSVPNDVTAGTATGTQTSTTLQDTNQAWTTNALNGMSVTITGGTGAGQVRAIASNTNNTLTVSSAWTTIPVAGSSTYVVSDTKANQIAAFNASNHQYTASSTFGGTLTNTFNANCVKCHNDTLTKDKQTSTTKFGLHDSTLRTMVAPLGATPTDPLEQNFCFQCHSARDGTTNALLTAYWAAGNKTTDWYGVSTMTTVSMNLYAQYNDVTLTYKHSVGGYSGLHRPAPKDEDRTYLSANKHVECTDCHNPHATKRGDHTPVGTATGTQTATTLQDTNQAWATNAYNGMNVTITGGIGVGQVRTISSNTGNTLTVTVAWTTIPVAGSSTYVVQGGSGTSLVSTSGPLAGAPGVTLTFGVTNWSSPTAYPTEVGRATYEYEICFQCHSSYNTALTTWNTAWTDAALEFNPNNSSYHAVAGAAKTSAFGAYINGWTATSRMYCSDCHTNNKTTANDPPGPHASANPHILLAPWNPTGTGTTATTDLCMQCHDPNVYLGTATGGSTGFSAGTNNLHTEHASRQGMSSYRCTMCHAARPHGWSRARLIVYKTDPSPYRLAAEPDMMGAWTINTGNYVKGNCTGGVGQCAAHP